MPNDLILMSDQVHFFRNIFLFIGKLYYFACSPLFLHETMKTVKQYQG